jgi:hypothetical protein
MEKSIFEDLETDPRKKIADHVARFRIRYSLLADELNYSTNHIKDILKCRVPLKEEHRQKINELLGTNY